MAKFGTVSHVRQVLKDAGFRVAVPTWRSGAQVWRNKATAQIMVDPSFSSNWLIDLRYAQHVLSAAGYNPKVVQPVNCDVLAL